MAPSCWRVHGALVLAQAIFGGGSVVGKLGLPTVNPVLFALVRECIAGPILWAAAHMWHRGLRPARSDFGRLFALAFCIFSNQLAGIVGIKLSNPIVYAAWQPTQPVFTCLICLCLRTERCSSRKFMGIVLSTGGAMAVALWGSSPDELRGEALAQFFLLVNCVASSGYVILCKPIRQKYPGLCVTAWAYMGAALMMLLAATALTAAPPIMRLLGCTAEQGCEPWRVPTSTIAPLAYWILGNSVLSYSLITWANAFAPASAVSCYTVLQPVVSAALCWVLIAVNPSAAHPVPPEGDGYGLQPPAPKDACVLLIGLGLLLVVYDAERSRRRDQRTEGERYAQAARKVAGAADTSSAQEDALAGAAPDAMGQAAAAAGGLAGSAGAGAGACAGGAAADSNGGAAEVEMAPTSVKKARREAKRELSGRARLVPVGSSSSDVVE